MSLNPLRSRAFLLLPLLFANYALSTTWASDSAALSSTWPQPQQTKRLKAPARLQITNAYYTIEHDLTRGGAISSIALRHGKGNLLVSPVAAEIRDAKGETFSDVYDRKPRLTRINKNGTPVFELEARLRNSRGVAAAGITLKTRIEHHWGYVKTRREFVFSDRGFRVTGITPFKAVLQPNLSSYGYRDGLTEQEKAPPFSFGSCRWGQLGAGQSIGLKTNFLPRYVMCAEPSVQGLEWFMGSDLHQWDLQATGERGSGECLLASSQDPTGVLLTISAISSPAPVAFYQPRIVFDYFIGLPLKEGRAVQPWLHTSFNRNRGDWVSAEQVRRWAESGIQTVHCHNDGDYYEDGLFWRDGSYPPYPDMDRYDKVLNDCRAAGIRTATYFSNKELHPSTEAFRDNGQEWGRKNLAGRLQHNIFRGTNEFGAQMCLRSGWLEFLKGSIDRVVRAHPLDGVYYDWNVALLCHNPAHEPKATNAGTAAHWDIEELLHLMEWTRSRVGPAGMVIVHNTTTPMFVMENFADYVVANEWGYGKWKEDGPKLDELPLEWALVGARPRGVISYGQLDDKSPRRLHRVFALQALVSGVTPWPASAEATELYPILKPIGQLETCRFLDWRNRALTVSGERCASAIYSRPGEAWFLVVNYGKEPQLTECKLTPELLPYHLQQPSLLTLEAKSGLTQDLPAEELKVEALVKAGIKLTLPGDSAVLLRLR